MIALCLDLHNYNNHTEITVSLTSLCLNYAEPPDWSYAADCGELWDSGVRKSVLVCWFSVYWLLAVFRCKTHLSAT